MKTKKIVYRVGDIVRIKNPLVVERVGYPWNKEYVIQNIITNDQKKMLDNLIRSIGLSESSYFGVSTYYDFAYNKILDELSYWALKNKGFGGSTRSLFTKSVDEYNGKLASINSKRVVKTGNYSHGRSDWEGDYTPAYLSNEKSHVLLDLMVFTDEDKWSYIRTLKTIEIEECNVELHEKMKRWKVYISPNNQPNITLGTWSARTMEEAKRLACDSSGILQSHRVDVYVEELI